ncbi:response regulator [Sungkyunkwania multivorans]|uniref:histidine kinase n=1 Tax=Sungkyunkwania multivorans TaxID=1173618 RepID=A0ABW3CXV6_9FLAO
MLLHVSFLKAQEVKNYSVEKIDEHLHRAYRLKHNARYDEALQKTQEALKIADVLEVDEKVAACYNIVASINLEKEKYDHSLEYSFKAENIQKNIRDFEGLIITLTHKGLAEAKKENFQTALQYLQEAKTIAKRYNINRLMSRINISLGIVYLGKNNLIKAEENLKSALPVKDPLEDNYLRGKTMLLLARINENNEDYAQAKEHALEANNIAKAFNFPLISIDTYKLLSEISEKTEAYQDAVSYLKKYHTLEDSILSSERLASELSALAETDAEIKDRMIGELENENADFGQTVKTAKLTSILSSALLIIISLLTISLYRNNQIKIKTNQLLVKKNNELQLAKDKAEKAMNTKAQFLSTVSHELRTPLYAVTGLTHLLLEDNPSKHQEEHLKSLKFSGEYLLAFINDILQINKIEAKKLNVKKDDFSLHKILNDVISSLNATAKENNNKIHLVFDEKIPPFVIGDSLKLSQIFINLVGNALKFTENGDVWIIVDVIGKDDKTIDLSFKVKDNGIGISKEMQHKIFESFAQGSVQINRKYGGTGLGLTIVRSLLELLDSEIKLSSELGKGSTFGFDITFNKSDKVKDAEDILLIDKKDNFLEGLHVLLVEDNKINQVITKKMIEKKGMTCDIASDGYKAIDLAMEQAYDIILMDIHMPGISGLQTTQEIRKFNTKVPIVALTAISLDENTDDFYKAGCDDIITKPFKPEVFYKKISKNIVASLQNA